MTRDEVIERLKFILETDIITLNEFNTSHEPLEKEIEALKIAIKALEQEPKTGHWIPLGYEDEWWGEVCTCSECGSAMFRNTYCPNCGAKMVEPQESEGDDGECK